MSEAESLIAHTADRLFADHVTPALLAQAEAGSFAATLWQALEDQGLTRALAPETEGGAGLGWADVGPLLTAQGYHHGPVPLGETLLAQWLAGKAGLAVPAGPLAVVDGAEPGAALAATGGGLDLRLTGSAEGVAWAGAAAALVVALPTRDRLQVLILDRDAATLAPGHNMAKEPRPRVAFASAAPMAQGEASLPPATVRLYGALVRAGQMAGALARVLDFTTRYANERKQFGKAIGKFQAVQQQIAELACEVAAANHAARIAFAEAEGPHALAYIASAKIRAGEAAAIVNAIAHQVHGAIGFTHEHPLHYATRRLWAWRAEYGAERDWSITLGRAAAQGGGQALWPSLVGR